MHYEMERFGDNGYIEYANHYNFSYPHHFHRCLEFIFVNSGSIYVLTQNEKIKLEQGESVLFLPFEIHGYESIGDSHYWSLVFSPDLVAPFIAEIDGKRTVQPKIKLTEAYLKQPSEIKHLLQSSLKVKGLLLIICGNYLDQVELTDTLNPNDNLLFKVIEYIGAHFKESINLQSVAHAIGYDHSYLSRFISANMHTTFHKYLTSLRLSHAVDLLRTSQAKIVDIALQSGFPTTRTFNSAFKKEYGVTPREFKQIKTSEPIVL